MKSTSMWEFTGMLLSKVGTKVMGDVKWKEYTARVTVEQENFKLLRVEHKDDGRILVIHAMPKTPFKDEDEELVTVYAICRTVAGATKLDYIYFDKIGISGSSDYIYKFTSDKLTQEKVKLCKETHKAMSKVSEAEIWYNQGRVVDRD